MREPGGAVGLFDRVRQSQFLTNIVLTAVSLGCYGLTKVGFNVLVLKFTDSATVGLYNLALSASAFVSILLSNLVCISLSKFSAEALGRGDNDEFLFVVNVSFWLLVLLSALCSALFWVLAPWVAAQVGGGDPSVFRWSAPLILLNGVYNYFKSLSYVVDKVARYTVLEVIGLCVFGGTLAACLWTRWTGGLLLPMILQLGFFSVVSTVSNRSLLSSFRWLRNLRAYGGRAVGLVKYSLITGVGTTASMVTAHTFTLVLGRIADAATVGYVAVVNSAVDPLNFVPRVLTVVSFPRISYLYGKQDFPALRLFVRRNFRRLALICLALCAAGFVFSRPVSEALFADRIAENDWLLRIMIVSRAVLIAAVFHIALLSGTRYPLIPNLTGPASLVLCLPLVPVAYHAAGIPGIGLVMLVSAFLRAAPPFFWGERYLGRMET